MGDRKHFQWAILVTLFAVVGGVVIITKLPELSDVPQFMSSELKEKLSPYQENTAIERQQLEQEQLLTARWEQYRRRVEIKKEIDYLPQKMRIRAAWSIAFIVSFCALFAGVGIGLCVAIIKVSTANSDVIAMALLSKRITPGQERIELEKWRLMREQMRLFGLTKDAPMLDELKDITPPVKTPDALECLQQGKMSAGNPSFFFGTMQDGNPAYEDIVRGKSGQALIGAEGVGKSNDMVNTGVQAMIKGWLLLIVDLHFPDDESLTAKFGLLREAPNMKYFSEHEDVLTAMYLLDSIVEGRLKGTLPKDPQIIVFIDELLNLIDLFRDDEVALQLILKALKRVTTEGRKNNMRLVAGSHSWKVEDIGSSTFRNNLMYRKAFRADRDSIRTLTKNNRLVSQCESLEDGECVYMTPKGQIKRVQVPLWTPDALKKAASMVREVSWPDLEQPTESDLQEYCQKVVKLADYLTDDQVIDSLINSGLTAREIANRSGVEEHTIGELLNRKRAMYGSTKRKLLKVIG